MNAPRNLREELLALETPSADLKAQYERRLEEMKEKTLKPWQRVCWTLSGLMGVGFFLVFGYATATSWGNLPWQATVCFASGSVFGVAWALMAFSIVRKGKFNLRKHGAMGSGIVWGAVLIGFIMFSMLAFNMPEEKKSTGILMVLSSIGYLIMGVAFLLRHVIETSTAMVQEDVLRLQLQLADLEEKLVAPKDSGQEG